MVYSDGREDSKMQVIRKFVEDLEELVNNDEELDDEARAARDRFRGLVAAGRVGLEERIATAFRTCRGGENLIALGMEADLATAAAIDSLAVVPRLDREAEALVAAS
jgi:hypothetical protein